jgi:hypothetical protein
MSEDSTSDCLICRKQRGDFYVPGEAIHKLRAFLRQEEAE